MNTYNIKLFFIVSSIKEEEDFNLLHVTDNTKKVLLNYIEIQFWEDILILINELKLNKITSNFSSSKIGVEAFIESDSDPEDLYDAIDVISEKSIWQVILQPTEIDEKKYCVYDENIKRSCFLSYINNIEIE